MFKNGKLAGNALCFLLLIVIILFLQTSLLKRHTKETQQSIKTLVDMTLKNSEKILELEKKYGNDLNKVETEIKTMKSNSIIIQRPPAPSRGSRTYRKIRGIVTAYTLSPNECGGKKPGDPGYAHTFSGAIAKYYHTVGVNPKVIPLGSIIYIPYFDNWPNKGIFYAEDTGSGGYTVDVLTQTVPEALKIGKRELDIYIIKEGK